MKFLHPFAILAASTTAAVQAQAPEQTLPETVVVADRIETPLAQSGSAVTVIDAAQLAAQNVQTVADALRGVPGVAVSRSGGLGSLTDVRIRGAESDHTLVLIDGVEANDPAFGSRFDFGHLLVTEIERIEILRGSQSALWGSDAIGGVINIITKRGKGPARAHASIEGGSFGSGQLGAGVSGGGDAYHYALGGAYLHSDGISIAPTGTEKDGYDNGTLSFKGGVSPRANLAFDIAGRYTVATSETDPQDFGFPPGPTFGQVIDGNDESKVRQFYGRAQGKLMLFDGRWEQRLGAALTDTDNRNFSDGVKINTTLGRKTKFDYQSSLFFDALDADHSVIFALERETEDFKQRGLTPDAPENQDESITNIGYIGEYRLGIGEHLFLTGAVRQDDNDRFADATTYRLTGAYRWPDAGTRLHASLGTGVKNPSFIELFGFFPGTFIGNPDLKPEQSTSWDVGVEQALWGGNLLADVTYFHSIFKDEITPTFDSDTFLSSVENGMGKSRREGVELSLSGELRADLSLTASYTYTSSRDPEGEDEVRRPRHQAGIDVNYRFLGDRAHVDLGVKYVGEQEDFDFRSVPAARVTLGDYVLVDVSGAYKIGNHLELYGRIDNLLDQDYQEVFGYNTPGIGAFVGLKAEF
ncbi:MAG: TonB-dependent receptor [Gammaproteobacteria bacterium]